MRDFAIIVPLFLPGMVVAAVIGLLVAPALARRLGCRVPVAFLLVISLGLIAAATLTPVYGAITDGIVSTGTCDLSRPGWAPLSTYLHVNDTSLNVLLFVPLGISLGLIPGRTGLILAGGAMLLSAAVELTQMLLPVLGRSCQTRDIVDNTTGLVIGLVIGWLLAAAVGSRRLRTGR